MDGHIGRELRDKIENPVIFQTLGAAAASPVSRRAVGYDASILIDVCNAVLEARAAGKLSGGRYDKMIEQARRARVSIRSVGALNRLPPEPDDGTDFKLRHYHAAQYSFSNSLLLRALHGARQVRLDD